MVPNKPDFIGIPFYVAVRDNMKITWGETVDFDRIKPRRLSSGTTKEAATELQLT